MERIIVEVGGDPSKLDSTINKLEQIGDVDQKNADQFKKNNTEYIEAAKKREFLLEREVAHLKSLRDSKSKAFDPGEIASFNAAIKNSEQRMNELNSATQGVNVGMTGAVTTAKELYSALRIAANILPGIGISGLILAGWNALSTVIGDVVGDLFDAKEQIEKFNKENKITNDNIKETTRLHEEEYKMLIRFKVIRGELSKAQADQLLKDVEYEDKRKKRLEKFEEDKKFEREILGISVNDIKKNGLVEESVTEEIIQGLTGKVITQETLSKKEIENRKDYNKKYLELYKQLVQDLVTIDKTQGLDIPDKDKSGSGKAKGYHETDQDRRNIAEMMRIDAQQEKAKKILQQANEGLLPGQKEAGKEGVVWYNEEMGITLEDHNATVSAIEALKKKEHAQDVKEYKKYVDEIIDLTQTITDAVEESIKMQMKANDIRIKNTDKNIDIQKTLAEKGLANDLAFEEKRRNALSQAQVKEQIKLKHVKELEIFLNAMAKFADSDPGQALAKSLGLLASAKIAESTIGHAEHGGMVGELSQRKKVGGYSVNGMLFGQRHSSGGILTEMEAGEGIFSRNEVSNMGGKKGFYMFKELLKQPIKEKMISSNTFLSIDQSKVVDRLERVEKAIQNQPHSQVDYDGQQQMIVTTIRNGIKETMKHIRPRL